MKNIAVKLYPAAEKKTKQGHPWIFDQSIKHLSKSPNTGDIAVIFDQKKNKFLAAGIFDMDSPIRIKLLVHGTSLKIDATLFKERIRQAKALREPIFKVTNAYRLVYGEQDLLPGLIIDVYNHTAVIKLYSAIWLTYLQDIANILLELNIAENIVLRLSRNLQKGTDKKDGELLAGNLESETIHFDEYDVKFSADVKSGHKSGYFLDHRWNRNRVGELSRGKTLLDVFSYTGGFSVHALVNGAKSVTSIDISGPALEKALYNAALNEYNGAHDIMKGDAFEQMEILINRSTKFDIVVIDPPSFAKSKKEVEGALLSYKKLATLGSKLVNKGGVLVMASCSARISADEFFHTIEQSFKKNNLKFRLEQKTFHDIDHPVRFLEGGYLKCGYYLVS